MVCLDGDPVQEASSPGWQGGECLVLVQTLWCCFSAGCFLSLYSGKRILTQMVCRAVSAVQTAQPQYVTPNCFVKHMHQLYLFALKL